MVRTQSIYESFKRQGRAGLAAMFGKHQIQNHGEIWQGTKQEWSPSASRVHRIQYPAMCVTRSVLCGFTAVCAC